MDTKHCAVRDCFNGKTFLVIDQDYFLVDEARRLIEAWGGCLIVVRSVEDAQDVVTNRPVDAAIIDIDIETQEALLLCQQLDELDIPFIFAFSERTAQSVGAHGGFTLGGSIETLAEIGTGLFHRSAAPPYAGEH